MIAPWGIVLVPTEAGSALTAWNYAGDGVLAPGGRAEFRSARPPIVYLRDTGQRGLAVVWSGLVELDGWDHARRVWGDHRSESPNAWPADPDASVCRGLVRALEAAGLCRVVLLDLVDGVVRVVRERAP